MHERALVAPRSYMYRIEKIQKNGGKREKDLSTTWNKCNPILLYTYTNIHTTDNVHD